MTQPLSYATQHDAWKQRLNQEKVSACNFNVANMNQYSYQNPAFINTRIPSKLPNKTEDDNSNIVNLSNVFYKNASNPNCLKRLEPIFIEGKYLTKKDIFSEYTEMDKDVDELNDLIESDIEEDELRDRVDEMDIVSDVKSVSSTIKSENKRHKTERHKQIEKIMKKEYEKIKRNTGELKLPEISEKVNNNNKIYKIENIKKDPIKEITKKLESNNKNKFNKDEKI